MKDKFVLIEEEQMGNKTWIWVVVIVVVVFLLYAFGIFGNQPLFAPFDASVGLANAPPTTVALLPVYDRLTTDAGPGGAQGTDDNGEVLPVAALGGNPGNVFAVVEFIVEDPDHDFATATSDLSLTPSVVTLGSPTAAASEIAVQISSPSGAGNILCAGPGCRDRNAVGGTFPTGGGATCNGIECGDESDPEASDCNNGADVSPYSSLDSNKQVKYICYVQITYFDEQTVGTGAARDEYWDIGLYIEDVGGNGPIPVRSIDFDASPGSFDTPGDEDLYVDINAVNGMDTVESLSFTSIVSANFDQAAAADVTFRNRGNTGVTTATTITAQDLVGDVVGGANLLVASMSIDDAVAGTDSGTPTDAAGGTGACDGPSGAGATGTAAVELLANSPVDADGLAIPFTASGTDSDDLFFCIWDSLATGCGGTCLTGGSDSTYSATNPITTGNPGEQWEVTPVFS